MALARVLVIVCCPLAFGLLSVLRRRQIRGTTLVAPWVWSGISLGTLAAVELSIALAGEPLASWAPAARYAAAMSTFTPIMALLGAKRPQDRGWQWIVLTLWLILCQPAAEWLLFGGVAEIHPARFWFQMILVVVGATNGLGTRNWADSLVYGGGQILLLFLFYNASGSHPAEATALAAFSGILAIFASAGSRTLFAVRMRPAAGRLDRVWLDFRDEFGVVWALRIQERMNTSARMYDWPVMLAWQGFRPREAASTEVPQLVEESFRTLLRRFVSAEWIDARVAREPISTAVADTSLSA